MEVQLLFEFLVQMAEVYPIISDIIFWFGIVWLLTCIILNVVDFFAGLFKWNLNNKFVLVLRAFCERCGPSLSMFGKWSHRRRNKPPLPQDVCNTGNIPR